MGRVEKPNQTKGLARAVKRYFSMKKRRPACREWKDLRIAGEKRLTRLPDEGNQRSRRSERADHVREHRVWEPRRGGHCESSAVTRRVDSERAAHESAGVRRSQ